MKKIITLLALISLGTGFIHAQSINMSIDTPEGSVNMGMDIKETPDGGVQMNMRMDTPEGTVNTGVSGSENGMNTNMNIQERTTTTTTITTTTTSSSTSTNSYPDDAPVDEVVANPNKCMYAMSASDFSNAQASLKKQTFEDSKLQVAKQIADANCLSASQVKSLMGLFTYEVSKLEIAKFCYAHTIDKNNYYTVNDAFTYSSSVEELNEYLSTVK